ncbi:putative iroquois-class homeodomain protein irx-1 isoform X1 [Sycon ciliatum]|uniref:putative iroquois-class homeodomain protein irx-1 isoform X1 n=1 Tax=Sycon ciliatum TaxID=27933 RepID=UPI0031F60CEA
MMSHVSNTNQSSLMCPTIAWTPTPRSCMELSQPIAGFRHNTLSSSNANHSLLQPSSSPVAASAVSTEPPAFCVTSNAHHQSGPVSGQLSPQSLQHSPSQHQPHGQVSPPHGQVSPPPCTAPMSSRVSWMQPSPVERSPAITSSSPDVIPSSGRNLLIPSNGQPVQRSQVPLVMLPISVAGPPQQQTIYESRPAVVQTLSHQQHRPAPLSAPAPSGPCYYQNLAPSQTHPYSHQLMLSHEAPVSQRERTKPLRDWILKHRSHPYPSKEDKLALAMMTRMRLDQVSMWFANTRRQIRKVGMKAWSGGLFSAPLPHRVGNGAIIPVPDEEREDDGEEESSLTCSSDDSSSGRILTDSSCSME